MKNYPYNTGRTVTISLDTLGNAAIWQIFQILTDGTNNIFQGDEPDASPAADSDAATEIFLHLAETADDRADGADAGQRAFLLGIKDEYLDIFETNPADDLRKRLGEEAAEEAANVDPEEAYLAETIAAWRARPENAELDALLEANAIDTSASPENLYRAGVFEGLAAALHTQIAWATDDYNEIRAAIYKAYGVAY